jgi:RNA polymerase sigma factor (sigma-70 family)
VRSVPATGEVQDAFVELTPLVRRVIAARVRDQHTVDDLVQETLARVMAARPRLKDSGLAPYAVVTARNLVISMWQREDRDRRHAHRLVDVTVPRRPDEDVLQQEESRAVAVALDQLSERERDTLVAHELEGEGTASLATTLGSTPGAVAVALSRARAKLRVEYLLALEGGQPPTSRCRPVLLSLSAGDRRRQRELDTGGHLLECGYCAAVSQPLLEQGRATATEADACIPILSDADVVRGRQKGRELAAEVGFSSTELTLIATAISEVARNIVRFAARGEILVRLVERNGRRGVTIVARDAGPGIPDVSRAMADGYSTYQGLGLGLPGSRRLMDEFEIVSEVGKGTTVTMTKWRPDP